MAKRRHFGKEFKARVALEAIKGIKTVNQGEIKGSGINGTVKYKFLF